LWAQRHEWLAIVGFTQVVLNRASVHSIAMTTLGPTWRGVVMSGAFARSRGSKALLLSLCLLVPLITSPQIALAAPFIWDQDDDHIDDRIETVHVLGYAFAFEQGDTQLRQRIDVSPGLAFGVYVIYSTTPGATDVAALAALGMPVLHRFEAIPVLRSIATYPQIQACAALPGVERVEAVPLLYPMLHEGAAAIRARDPSGQVFPNWSGTGGAQGAGVVVGVLDTGINDAPDGSYPGHESLIGRFLGGADFTHGDSTLDTPRDGSENPSDHGGSVTHAHGTHVAGIILGSGGSSGYAMGIAPQARFVDVKALGDVGKGTGVAEALDWCIHNRARNWGVPGYQGIQVINLSLSTSDPTDGNDVASRLASRAVQLGIVVVASIGNDGLDHHIPSPAGGDDVLAVGAIDTQRSPLDEDDQFAGLNDYGPRASDGDGDTGDEQKPDLLAPGIAVLSADGNLLSDGAQYQRLSGTSMAAAFVSGAVAALRSADPSLTPSEIASVLRATAHRDLGGVPTGVTGTDPGWYSPRGYGVIDLYAASLELTQSERSQVRQFELSGSGATVEARIRTMRERGAAHFVVERAPDSGDLPGAFAPYDSVAAAGDPTLADGTNLQSYSLQWSVPPGESGVAFWYRISYTEGGVRYDGPGRRFVSPAGPPAATVELTVVHNAYDTDLSGAIEMGAGPASTGLSPSASSPAISIPLPGSSAAIASDWVTGESTTGNVAWTFSIDIPHGAADAYLPPDSDHPLWLRVTEGGYLNRSGRVTGFRVIWHGPSGDQVAPGGPLPLQTLEGQTAYVSAPSSVVGVGAPAAVAALRGGPNPVPSGAGVSFRLGSDPAGELRVFDLAGREVGRAVFRPGSDAWEARWVSRDSAGQPIPAGLYFARAGRAGVRRLVVLAR
jgi:subtilisin family serine protease